MQSAKMDAEDNLACRVASFSYYLKTGDQENFVQKIGSGLVEEPISATIVSKETSFPSGRIKSAALINKPSYFSNSFDSQDSSIISNHRLSLLDDPPENFAFKVKPGAALQDPKSAAALVLSQAAGPTPKQPAVEKMNIPANGEIGVFGADKYFNMKLEYVSRMKNESCKNQVPIDLPGMKSNYLRSATPSVYSEASSWASGTALLKTSSLTRNSGSRSTSKPKTPLGRRIIASFGCTGRCMDSGAVYVAENGRGDSTGTRVKLMSQQGSKRADPFAFPILCPDTQSLSARKKLEDEKMEELRKSLDVFGSETMKRGDIATNLERKLSILTWDAIIPKSSNHHPTTTTVGSPTVCDDMASDASSDLFEIENISGNMGYPILNMQAGGDDDVSGYCTSPTTQCYAPSEASIEWSVVTASAADFSSVISDYDEKYIGLGVGRGVNSAAADDATGKKFMRSKNAGLLGCKSQKAVNVSETVHKSRVERY